MSRNVSFLLNKNSCRSAFPLVVFCLPFCVLNYIQFFRSIFEPMYVYKYIICLKYSLLSKAQKRICVCLWCHGSKHFRKSLLIPVWFVDFLCVPFFRKHRWPMSLSQVLAVWAAIPNTVFTNRSNSCLWLVRVSCFHMYICEFQNFITLVI